MTKNFTYHKKNRDLHQENIIASFEYGLEYVKSQCPEAAQTLLENKDKNYSNEIYPEGPLRFVELHLNPDKNTIDQFVALKITAHRNTPGNDIELKDYRE